MGELDEDVFCPELFRQYYDPFFLFAFTIKRTLKFSLSWIFYGKFRSWKSSLENTPIK